MTVLERHRTPTLITYRAAEGMPSGVVGQLEGIALVYDVPDAYGCRFAQGCLDKTRQQRVAKGKVKLFWDHGDALQNGSYDTDLHIGVVRALEDRRLSDGRSVAWLHADIFDTEMGRKAHEYLKAVAAAGGETGLSVNFHAPYDDKGKQSPTRYEDTRQGDTLCRTYLEIPLREVSVTSETGLPGTLVKQVRSDSTQTIDYEPLMRGIHATLGGAAFRALSERISGDALNRDSDAESRPQAPASDSTPEDSQPAASEAARTDFVPFTDRLEWSRHAFARLYPDGTDS